MWQLHRACCAGNSRAVFASFGFSILLVVNLVLLSSCGESGVSPPSRDWQPEGVTDGTSATRDFCSYGNPPAIVVVIPTRPLYELKLWLKLLVLMILLIASILYWSSTHHVAAAIFIVAVVGSIVTWFFGIIEAGFLGADASLFVSPLRKAFSWANILWSLCVGGGGILCVLDSVRKLGAHRRGSWDR